MSDDPTPAGASDPVPYDAGNQRHVERREKAAKTARRQRDEAFRWLMADGRGRRIVWGLLGKAGVFRSSMAGSPELTAFNEGRRDLGLSVLADVMRLCPERYAQMQAEAHSTGSGQANAKPTATSGDVGFNALSAGGNYTRNNALFGVWVETAQASTAVLICYMGNDETNYGHVGPNTASTIQYGINAVSSGGYACSTQTGVLLAQRTASALFYNGANVGNSTAASVLPANRNFNILGGNNGGSLY